MASSHHLPGGRDGQSRGRVEGEQNARHPLLEGYYEWVDQSGDARELDRLAAKYPSLDLAEELRDFMAYADRRAGEGKAYVDYIAAFRNRLKAQFEYAKKRGWLPEQKAEELTADQARARLAIV